MVLLLPPVTPLHRHPLPQWARQATFGLYDTLPFSSQIWGGGCVLWSEKYGTLLRPFLPLETTITACVHNFTLSFCLLTHLSVSLSGPAWLALFCFWFFVCFWFFFQESVSIAKLSRLFGFPLLICAWPHYPSPQITEFKYSHSDQTFKWWYLYISAWGHFPDAAANFSIPMGAGSAGGLTPVAVWRRCMNAAAPSCPDL